jgi:two-component system, LuxR family, response regulator FixJ
MNTQPCVFIVDDDFAVRDSLQLIMETADLDCQAFDSAEHFLETYRPGRPGCLLLDVNMPGINGDELQAELIHRGILLPVIFLTAHGDIPMTVRTIKAGAVDFLTKPVPRTLLLERIQAVLEHDAEIEKQSLEEQSLCNRLNTLTPRELEILPLVLAGKSNKEVARHIGISYRTVEIHRGRILKKTETASLLELARLCEVCKITPGLKPGHP